MDRNGHCGPEGQWDKVRLGWVLEGGEGSDRGAGEKGHAQHVQKQNGRLARHRGDSEQISG